jgi:hypothetical protein
MPTRARRSSIPTPGLAFTRLTIARPRAVPPGCPWCGPVDAGPPLDLDAIRHPGGSSGSIRKTPGGSDPWRSMSL